MSAPITITAYTVQSIAPWGEGGVMVCDVALWMSDQQIKTAVGRLLGRLQEDQIAKFLGAYFGHIVEIKPCAT